MLEPVMGMEGLILSGGMQHKNSRKCLNPLFNSIKLKEMLERMNDITEGRIDKWLPTESKKRISMHKQLSVLVLEILLQILFDTDYRASDLEMEKVIDNFESATKIIFDRLFYMTDILVWLDSWPIYQKSTLNKYKKDLLAFVNKIIYDRQTKQTDADDLLNLLLSPKNGFNEKQIREQILSFLIAGHDTVATLLSWTMFILMTKPTVYEACRNEVDTVLIEEKPAYDQLNKLKILNAVIQETLRMYPPIPIISRECIQEHFIGPNNRKQIHIPRGATVTCDIRTVHYSSKYWPNPEEFDYTRWMKDENGNPPKLAHPCCFLPFAVGNRNCIGNLSKPNLSHIPEQHRTSNFKESAKPAVDQSFDIDAILQGRSIQPQQSGKGLLNPIGPSKNSASSATRRDSLTDWLNEDRSTTKNQSSNLFSNKITTNVSTKPTTHLDPDDFFSNTHSRDQSATRAPQSTTKSSAKQYYLGNSRYKPGINPKQTVRGDNFNWLMDPSDNSNSASRAPKLSSYAPTFGEQRK
ncbi:unnamed protein product, partial [Adineta steineri]